MKDEYQREPRTEEWWREKSCPLTINGQYHCVGSVCAFWYKTREADKGILIGVCVKG